MKQALADGEHLVRLLGLFAAGLLTFFLAQGLLVPKGFGVYGHYRAGALDDNGARRPAYAGRASCEECHSDVAEARKEGKHAAFGCEACHGPQAHHAAAPDEVKPERPDGRDLCLVCHTANVAKPNGFPQVHVKDHAGEAACVACHRAHNPGEIREGAQ